MPHVSTEFPENETLELPSSYGIEQAQQYGLHALAQFESQLRLGRAYDAIDDLRTAIHLYNMGHHEKRNEVFGQRPNTRASAALRSLRQDIHDCARRYNSSYSALVALGLPKNSELKPISEKELWGKDMTLTGRLGDSKRKEPWYWVIGKPKDISDSAWGQERAYTLNQFASSQQLTFTQWTVSVGSVHVPPVTATKKNSKFWTRNSNEHTVPSPE